MGIETDLSTATEYSIAERDFEPYNPALILGGLEVGVTPLEMAHAYNTLAADGKRLSGTMAASSGGPLAIVKVETCGDEDFTGAITECSDRELVEDNTGASGENEVVAKQVIDPAVAATAKDVLSTVVESGTGENAATGEPTWGKTGTTDDNGDAWFCGATEEITACVWVGHADTVTPMETEFAGAPVDGGTFPALIFADVVNAYQSLEAARGDEERTRTRIRTRPRPTSPPRRPRPRRPRSRPPRPGRSSRRRSRRRPRRGGSRTRGPRRARRARRRRRRRRDGRRARTHRRRHRARLTPAPRPTPRGPRAARDTRCPPRRSARAAPWRG